ncbi:carboxypeptidase regulatory-like domain-containing protein [Aeromicrobium fastidiosum]|uniref:alpha-amylase n=1 Tax=Aeromicrobium fastidiosum TaxID=52699 RepID=A0A641AKC8_9ACTN|nr:carboxypeptidase regulatory-like domain-containing protein [Aeromicrobium fastidiosum]KAA1376265.1 hypothetical protein ESP62_012570 [Aeromicrobium fastidiosum]MBP2391840.1 hypothetical protein [Aeromicrobium fastidiosum]
MNVARTVRTPSLLLGVAALVLAGLTSPAQAAAKTGAVKGVVKLDGKPLKGVTIELHRTGDDGFDYKTLDVDTTNSKGAYSFRFSTADPEYTGHTILIKDPSGRIVNTSRRFKDRPGRTVTRNASVKPGASIVGSVTRGDGILTSRLRVDVFGPSDPIDHDRDEPMSYDPSAKAARDGSFRLGGLPAGDYYLQFVDDGKTYFPQCYDSLPAATTECDGTFTDDEEPVGTKITVGAGQTVTVKPQTMSTKGRRISGTVTDTSGRPIRGASVSAAGVSQPGQLTADSAKSGAFTIGPVVDGSYRLAVAPHRPWAPQSVSSAIDVKGVDVSGVAIRLKSRASIKATLTPGKGSVTVVAGITRSATGSKPGGKVTIRWGSVAKTVNVVKGRATVKLSGLPKGTRTITVSYAGTSSTAATSKTFRAAVK